VKEKMKKDEKEKKKNFFIKERITTTDVFLCGTTRHFKKILLQQKRYSLSNISSS
jgi:hypothetical protein